LIQVGEALLAWIAAIRQEIIGSHCISRVINSAEVEQP